MTKEKMNIDDLLAQSSKTDVKVLLSVKEQAKRELMENPSSANIAALDKATTMLEKAMQTQKSLKDYKEVLDYVKEGNRKLGKTKLFEDINKAKLKKQADGSFKIRDVDRYMLSLPTSATPDGANAKALERQKRKEEADIKRAEAVAEREVFDLHIKKGLYIPREQVHLELAARAVTLSAALRTTLEAQVLDLVDSVDGNPKKSSLFVDKLNGLLDEAFNDYSREMDIVVTFSQENTQE